MGLQDNGEGEPVSPLPPRRRKRIVRPKMRRAFGELDEAVHAQKLRRRHRRQHFVRAIRGLVGRCKYCGRPANGATTCTTCLDVDHAYKATQQARADRLRGAKYRDEEGKLFRLRFEARMLPVPGPRHDGYDLPACETVNACEVELMKALGPKEAGGMSCPRNCPHFQAAEKPEVTKRRLGP